MATIFLSDAVGAERFLDASPQGAERTQNWRALSAAYAASFPAGTVRPVLRPEIYHTQRARDVLGVRPGDWHLAVKPVEHIRPFHGLPNVFVCDWPHPELSAATLDGSPFFDQLRLLRQAEAVLCCTGHTTAILRGAGMAGAMTMPPVVAPTGPEKRRFGSTAGCRFLCLLDVDQVEPQLGRILAGFDRAAARRPGLELLVCIRGPDAAALAASHPPGSAAVRVVAGGPDALAEEADFLLSAHAAPGLLVPLVEAMLARLPLVTTLTAGTASFLPPDAAVLIATVPDRSGGPGEAIGRFMPLTSFPAPAEAVGDALLAASALAPDRRQALADAAHAAAVRQFGPDAFARRVARLHARIAAARP